MLAKIKEFLFGKPAEVAAPYKVETPAPVAETKVEVVPAGTEATIAAPAPKPRAPAKPKAEPKPKAPAKPKAAK
jgi:hypothetical protein